MKINMVFNPILFLVLYLLIINMYGFIIMGIDKRKSIKKKWRTPEYVFFLVVLLGGALGTYAGMYAFHHKTLHAKFKIGIPLMIILNLLLIYYMIKM